MDTRYATCPPKPWRRRIRDTKKVMKTQILDKETSKLIEEPFLLEETPHESEFSLPSLRGAKRRSNLNHDNRPSYLGKRSLYNSFKFALEGLKFAFKTQANLRIHILIGALVIILGLVLGVSNFEMIILFLVITSVIVCELINTAVEFNLDLVNGNKFNPLVKIVKDVVAAAVLLASINALVIGVILFSKYIV